MKKNYRILLFFALMFLISSLTVFSAENSEDIKVFFRNIKVLVDGKEARLENEPFIYKDRVYVSLRAVSESLNSTVLWDSEKNIVSISTFKDFSDTNPLEGEKFIYGEILSIDKEKRTIHIYQHIDDNSIYEELNLKVAENVTIIMQRNDKKMNIDFKNLKIGDVVGMVMNKENKVRGIIIDI